MNNQLAEINAIGWQPIAIASRAVHKDSLHYECLFTTPDVTGIFGVGIFNKSNGWFLVEVVGDIDAELQKALEAIQ